LGFGRGRDRRKIRRGRQALRRQPGGAAFALDEHHLRDDEGTRGDDPDSDLDGRQHEYRRPAGARAQGNAGNGELKFCVASGGIKMTEIEPKSSPPPVVSDTGLAFIVYLLYFAGYLTGITKIIGVIIAHLQWRSADPIARSHFQFQIRTFWIGLLYLAVGA